MCILCLLRINPQGANTLYFHSTVALAGHVDGCVSFTICVCERTRFVSSEVVLVLIVLRESVVDRRRDWLLDRDVVESRLFLAPLQLLGMLKAQRLW